MPKLQEFVKAWVSTAVAADKVPIFIIDEANIAFPNSNGQNGNADSWSHFVPLLFPLWGSCSHFVPA